MNVTELIFFDKVAANAFFEIYFPSPPDHVKKGESFDDFKLHLHHSTNPPFLDMERSKDHDDISLDTSGNQEGEANIANIFDDGPFDDYMICNETLSLMEKL